MKKKKTNKKTTQKAAVIPSGTADIAYQNKDVASKVTGEALFWPLSVCHILKS